MILAQTEGMTEGMVGLLIQAGFCGAFLVTMWVLFWLIRQRAMDWKEWMTTLVALHKDTQVVVAANTESNQKLLAMLASLCEKITEEGGHIQRLYEAMLKRPCLVEEEK